MSPSSTDFNLHYALRALRRRLPILLLCVVLIPVVAAVFSLLQTKRYTANASLLFRDPQFDQKLFGSSYVPQPTDPQVESATNLNLVALQRVAGLTAAALHITQQRVESAVSESSVGQSNLVTIQAVADSPSFAVQLANTYADRFIAFRRKADRAVIQSAEVPLQRQMQALPPRERFGALGQSLQQRLSQLGVLASLQTGNAEFVQPAQLPTGPSSPKPARNAAFGLFFGLLLGLALVLLLEKLDRRLRDPAEIEQIFERPLLASVPASPAFRLADPGLQGSSEVDREAFRMLWANLRYFTLSRDIRSVLITSPDRDDGKTTVAWGLGVAAANAGRRVLVVEADLRNPTFAARFKMPSHQGLSHVLAGDADLESAVVCLELPPAEHDPRPVRTMDALAAGMRPPDPTDLLQSRRMAEFLKEVRNRYELVVLDTPPAAVVSDAIPLLSAVDGVVVVSRLGNTLRDHAHRLRQQLDHLEAPVLGIVANSVPARELYEYSYGFKPSQPPTTNGAGFPSSRASTPAVVSAVGGSRGRPPADRTQTPSEEPAPRELARNHLANHAGQRGSSSPSTMRRRLRAWLG